MQLLQVLFVIILLLQGIDAGSSPNLPTLPQNVFNTLNVQPLTPDLPFVTSEFTVLGPMQAPVNDFNIETVIFAYSSGYTFVCMVTSDQTFWWEAVDFLVSDNLLYHQVFAESVLETQIWYNSTYMLMNNTALTMINYWNGSQVLMAVIPLSVNVSEPSSLIYPSFFFDSTLLYWIPVLVDWTLVPLDWINVLDSGTTVWGMQSCSSTEALLFMNYTTFNNQTNTTSTYMNVIQLDLSFSTSTNIIASPLVANISYPTISSLDQFPSFCYVNAPSNVTLVFIVDLNRDILSFNGSDGWFRQSNVGDYLGTSMANHYSLLALNQTRIFPVIQQPSLVPVVCILVVCVPLPMPSTTPGHSYLLLYPINTITPNILFSLTAVTPQTVGQIQFLDYAFGMALLQALMNSTYQDSSSIFYPRLAYTDPIVTTVQSPVFPVAYDCSFARVCYDLAVHDLLVDSFFASVCPTSIPLILNLVTKRYSMLTSLGNDTISLYPDAFTGTVNLSTPVIQTVFGVQSIPLSCILFTAFRSDNISNVHTYSEPQLMVFSPVLRLSQIIGNLPAEYIYCPAVLRMKISLIGAGLDQVVFSFRCLDTYRYYMFLGTIYPLNATATDVSWEIQPGIVESDPPANFTQTVIVNETIAIISTNATEAPTYFSWKTVACPFNASTDCTVSFMNYSISGSYWKGVPLFVPLEGPIVAVLVVFDAAELITGIMILNVLNGMCQLINVTTASWTPGTHVLGVYFSAHSPIASSNRTDSQLVLLQTPGHQFVQAIGLYLACPMGYSTLNAPGAPVRNLCTICPPGFYSDKVGADNCTACPDQTLTNVSGSTSISQCNACSPTYCHGNGDCSVDVASFRITCVSCSWTYTTTDNCKTPWGLIAIPTVLLSLFLVLLLSRLGFLYLKRHREEKAALESENRDYKQSWNIQWSAVHDVSRVDSGAYGVVWKGTWCDRTVAIKVMHDCEISDLADFEREARALRKYRHPQIVLFFGTGINHENQRFIVTEFVDLGSLRNVLDSIEDHVMKMNWTTRHAMSIDIATGMEFLHHQSPPLIHRDLKSPNVLVTANYRCKIGDLGTGKLIEISTGKEVSTAHQSTTPLRWFSNLRARRARVNSRGRSRSLQSENSLSSNFHDSGITQSLLSGSGGNNMSTKVGTPRWAAPEMLRGETNYGLPVDIYAYGIVCWELMTNDIPYPQLTWPQLVMDHVLSGKRPEWPAVHCASQSPEFVKMCEDCWQADQRLRPTAEMLMKRIILIV